MITIYENLLDTYQASGPVGQTVTAEKQKTQNEFQDLADSKKTPEQPTATGQPLTRKFQEPTLRTYILTL